jgi:hypothetical protein
MRRKYWKGPQRHVYGWKVRENKSGSSLTVGIDINGTQTSRKPAALLL